MADFDNGLPPQGTDVSAAEINAVLIGESEISKMNVFHVSSVVLEKEDATDSPQDQITGVFIDKQEAKYHNRCMFL